jgi:hypothetical protein
MSDDAGQASVWPRRAGTTPPADAADGEAETVTGEPVVEDGPEHDQVEPQRRERDPRERPSDPAGTQPRHDPESLLPARSESVALLGSSFAAPAGSTAPEPAEVMVPAGHGGEVSVPLPESEHAPRFQFLLGALGAIAAAAAAIAVAIVASPKPAPPVAWSSWHPVSGSDVDPAQQIADHVAPKYRLDSGHQIVAVQGGPLSLGGQPAEVALRVSGSQPSLLPGNGVIYSMCGTGASCSIGEGKPSAQRLLLLRREALELALYTFRYVGGVNQVVVTIPPPPSAATTGTGAAATGATGPTGAAAAAGGASSTPTSSTPNRVYFFRPGDVAPELDRPLGLSLSARTPTVSTVTRSGDAGLVVQLTQHNLYDVSLVQDSQSNPVLLLQPYLGG